MTRAIRVGATRTAEQAVPIGGGFFGKSEDFLRLHVDVAVMVGAGDAPLPPFDPAPSVPWTEAPDAAPAGDASA